MVNAAENDRIVWIDCEMTGLDLAVDELVEIAIVVTDFELNVLDPGFQIVIKPDDSALANMNEFVTNMHATSGLLEEIPNGVSLAEAEFEALEYIQRFVAEGKAPLAGNTIGTDADVTLDLGNEVGVWVAGDDNVVGGGAWGTALANAAAGAGHPVTLWLRDATAAAALQADRENPRYLPGVPLHPGIAATADPHRLADARATLLVEPRMLLPSC